MRNVLALVLFSTFLVNCSEVGFKESANASKTQSTDEGDALGTVTGAGGSGTTTDGGGTGTGGTGTGGGGTGGGGTGTMLILPKIQFIGPPCVRGSNCTVTFKLVTAQTDAVEFDWRTHDSFYLQTPPAGKVYAQPNVHYVPTNGHIKFNPGETSKTVYIQNINPYNYEVIIGVKMTNCYLGTYNDVCANFFQ